MVDSAPDFSKGIPFTQYLLPFGKKRREWVKRSDPITEKAKRILERGVVLEVEILRTGQVSFTAEDQSGEDVDVLAHEICANGPPVLEAVDRLIETAYASLFGEQAGT